jgi:hypothetical protein
MEIPLCFECMGSMNKELLVERYTLPRIDVNDFSKRLQYVSSKIQNVVKLANDKLNLGQKVIIVSQLTTFLERIKTEFMSSTGIGVHETITLTGKVFTKKRQQLVVEFQMNENINSRRDNIDSCIKYNISRCVLEQGEN